MKKIFKIFLSLGILFLGSACDQQIIQSNDSTIYTTSYPIEFLASFLYGEDANVTSIYPDGSDLQTYKLTNKQLNDYAKGSIFIYNGLTDEKDIARTLINKNNNLKIIDVSYGLTLQNSVEELWLSPSNFLMLAATVKENLEDLLDSKYTIETINENYEELQTIISQMDAELRTIANSVDNPTLVVDSNIFKFLENYGYRVISLEDENNLTPNSLASIQDAFEKENYKYILTRNDKDNSDVVNNLINNYKAQSIEMNVMSTIKEEQRKNNENYYTLLQQNIDNIRNVIIGG